MARRVDERKVELWTQRLRRYQGSELSVVEFCHREGVSVPSFYQWRSRFRGSGKPEHRPARQGQELVVSKTQAKDFAFQAIEVSSAASPVGMTVELPGQVQLRVAGDVRLIEAVMRQLIAATGIDRGGASC